MGFTGDQTAPAENMAHGEAITGPMAACDAEVIQQPSNEWFIVPVRPKPCILIIRDLLKSNSLGDMRVSSNRDTNLILLVFLYMVLHFLPISYFENL